MQEFGDTEGGSQEQKPRHVLRAEARSRQQSQYQVGLTTSRRALSRAHDF